MDLKDQWVKEESKAEIKNVRKQGKIEAEVNIFEEEIQHTKQFKEEITEENS